MIYLRSRKARTQQPRGTKRRLGTFKLLLGALLVWLIVSFNLQHLNLAMSGEDQAPSTWERVVRTVSGWLK